MYNRNAILKRALNPTISFILAFNYAFSLFSWLASTGYYLCPLFSLNLFNCFQYDALLAVNVFHQLIQAQSVLVCRHAGLLFLYNFTDFRRPLAAYEAKLGLGRTVLRTVVSFVPILRKLLLDVALSFFRGWREGLGHKKILRQTFRKVVDFH